LHIALQARIHVLQTHDNVGINTFVNQRLQDAQRAHSIECLLHVNGGDPKAFAPFDRFFHHLSQNMYGVAAPSSLSVTKLGVDLRVLQDALYPLQK
jgi:hypothetical protein